MTAQQAFENCMRRAEARRLGKFYPKNDAVFLYLKDGSTVYILKAQNPDEIVGLTATDQDGKPFRRGRYELIDQRLMIVGKDGLIESCVYDPMIRWVRRS